MEICDLEFNTDFIGRFGYNMDRVKDYIDDYNNNCVKPKLHKVENNISVMLQQEQYKTSKLYNANQMNSDSMKLYMNDYYYIISKGIIYVLVLGIFIYFFGINNLIEGVQTTTNVLKDKAIQIKDKAIEMKDKAVQKEIPKQLNQTK